MDLELKFDFDAFDSLDKFALLACQDYNFGNSSDWFGSFRGGLNGTRHRVGAVQRHHHDVHAWLPELRILADAEYHLVSLFFNMASAIDCMAFALNALGNCVCVDEFRDITSKDGLRKISPFDILGSRKDTPRPGYGNYFPSLQSFWQNKSDLIETISDQNNVAKHRECIWKGGQTRDDAPSGFFDSLGIPDDGKRTLFAPMAELFVHPDPGSPRVSKDLITHSDRIQVETLVNSFRDFMNESADLALTDAKAKIKLTRESFPE